jgi:hypothetical protein
MTAAARDLLEAFERLPETERLDLAAEILRRTAGRDLPPLAEDDLVTAAEELFLQLDAREAEAADARP